MPKVINTEEKKKEKGLTCSLYKYFHFRFFTEAFPERPVGVQVSLFFLFQIKT